MSAKNRTEDAIALLALQLIDSQALLKEAGQYDEDLKAYRSFANQWLRRSKELNGLNVKTPLRFPDAMFPEEPVSKMNDDQLAKKIFTDDAYTAYTRCRRMLELCRRFALPAEEIDSTRERGDTGDSQSDDPEIAAFKALESLRPAQRTIQINRYCRVCGVHLVDKRGDWHTCPNVPKVPF